MKRCFVLFFLLMGFFTMFAAEVENLRCEYLVNPLGVEAKAPRLSWVIKSERRGDLQTAYQLLVSSSNEKLTRNQGDIWNSGKIGSAQSIQVSYEGNPLLAGTRYYWKVRSWDVNGKPSKWSKPAYWLTGLLAREDWQDARWIAFKSADQWKTEWKQHKESELKGLPPMQWPNTSWPWFTGKDSTIFTLYEMVHPKYDPSPLFRKEFQLNKKVRSATLYVCGLGYYEAFLNGKKVGDHVLDPAWTNFEQRAMYVTYDVTNQLNKGANALGFMLGRGQYNPICNDIWGLSKSKWIDQPKIIALLRINNNDGTITDLFTDGSWKTSGGPIVYDDTRHGELYDARLEQKGWNSPSFNEDNWKNSAVVQWNAQLESQMMPPIRCFAPIRPVKTFVKGEGVRIYDIGINMAGWARVKVHGAAGARVLVEYCETPSDKELVPNIPLSRSQFQLKDKDYASFYDKGVNVRQQNGYILKGAGEETFECHFSYKGFQFVRVTADEGVQIDDVEGIPVHTDVERNGEFSCSNTIINKLQQNSVNSLLSNFYGISTDCPHREKQGWTADNYISAKAAMYNFHMAAFYSKWLTDLAGTQSESGGLGTVAPASNYDKNGSTAWPAAIAYIPIDLWDFYADKRPMEKNLEVMSGFAKSSLQRQVEGKPEIIRDVLGDWMAPLMVFSDSLRNNTMAPPEGMTLYGTAAHYRVVESVSKINRILGNETRAIEFEKWAQRIGRNFNLEFFDQKSKTYHGDKPTNFRQSANVVPLDYGLVREENREIVVQKVLQDIHENGDRLATGFLGTASMMAWLPQVDPELAFKLSTHRNYPGWGYMVEQGANTMWEAWDGDNSRNHPPFCLISEYFFRYLAGIQPDPAAPGFRHFFINPSVVGDLTFVNATHDCPYGSIKSNWKRENDLFILEVTVPVNTTATILLPAKPGSQISESGRDIDKIKGVRYLRYEQGKAVFELGSGNYLFQSKI